MLKQTFQSPQSYAIQAKIKTAGGPKECEACRKNAMRRHPKAVPLHPNCRCSEVTS